MPLVRRVPSPDPPYMGLGIDIQLIAQTVIYYCILLCGLLIVVPVAITTTNFQGFCIMYAEVINDKIEFGSSANCHFVTYMHVITSVAYAATLASIYTFAIIKSARGGSIDFLHNTLSNLVVLGFNGFVTFLALIGACVISVGFSRWCDSLLVNAHLHHGYSLQSCSEAEQLEWQNVDGSTFHSCYSLATASAWLCLFSWLVQTGLNVLVFIRYRKDDFGPTRLGSADNSPIHEPCTHAQQHERY